MDGERRVVVSAFTEASVGEACGLRIGDLITRIKVDDPLTVSSIAYSMQNSVGVD